MDAEAPDLSACHQGERAGDGTVRDAVLNTPVSRGGADRRVRPIVRLVVGAAFAAALAGDASARASVIDGAQRLFYNGRYEAAAAMTLAPCGEADLDACELRTSALLFQIKRALGNPKDKGKALKQCAACPALIATFVEAFARSREMVRARLQAEPTDMAALFLLGKLDLNYVWLQLGTLGRRTGWGEYWEARRSLDAVLVADPGHVRARVARAWIDYIVDTKLPMGTKWLMGGGDKKRGLRVVREAAAADAEFFAQAEADFALWDMQVREKKLVDAVATARDLIRDFPENEELSRFLEANGAP